MLLPSHKSSSTDHTSTVTLYLPLPLVEVPTVDLFVIISIFLTLWPNLLGLTKVSLYLEETALPTRNSLLRKAWGEIPPFFFLNFQGYCHGSPASYPLILECFLFSHFPQLSCQLSYPNPWAIRYLNLMVSGLSLFMVSYWHPQKDDGLLQSGASGFYFFITKSWPRVGEQEVLVEWKI